MKPPKWHLFCTKCGFDKTGYGWSDVGWKENCIACRISGRGDNVFMEGFRIYQAIEKELK